VSARVLVTRAAGTWPGLEARFETLPVRLQWDPTTSQVPPLDRAPGDAALAKLPEYDWLVLTSVRGVDALRDVPIPRTLRIAAVGPATAEAVGQRLVSALVADQASSAGLAETLRAVVKPKAKVLIVVPEGSPGVLATTLRGRGVTVDEAPLYRTIASARAQALADQAIAGDFAAVFFTAPSSLTLWLEASGDLKAQLTAALAASARIAIGPTTEAALAKAGLFAAQVAEAPTQEAAGDAIERALRSVNLLP
jgi:uroporphyrinogen III methyltransferase/synthase